jgi:hypothetical protein
MKSFWLKFQTYLYPLLHLLFIFLKLLLIFLDVDLLFIVCHISPVNTCFFHTELLALCSRFFEELLDKRRVRSDWFGGLCIILDILLVQLGFVDNLIVSNSVS